MTRRRRQRLEKYQYMTKSERTWPLLIIFIVGELEIDRQYLSLMLDGYDDLSGERRRRYKRQEGDMRERNL